MLWAILISHSCMWALSSAVRSDLEIDFSFRSWKWILWRLLSKQATLIWLNRFPIVVRVNNDSHFKRCSFFFLFFFFRAAAGRGDWSHLVACPVCVHVIPLGSENARAKLTRESFFVNYMCRSLISYITILSSNVNFKRMLKNIYYYAMY